MHRMGRGTARRAVEGQGDACHDRFGDLFGIGEHIAGRDADHAQAVRGEQRILGGVTLRLTTAIMRVAVDFDDQAGGRRVKVKHIGR